MYIKRATVPDTPLNDAYHVGSLNFRGIFLYLFNATFRHQLFIEIEKVEAILRCSIVMV